MIAIPSLISLLTTFVQPHEVQLQMYLLRSFITDKLQVGKALVDVAFAAESAMLADQFIFQLSFMARFVVLNAFSREIYKMSLSWWPELSFLLIAIINLIAVAVVVVLHFISRHRPRNRQPTILVNEDETPARNV